MRRILQPFYTSFALLTFLVSLLLAFPFFILIGLKDSGKARKILWGLVHYWSRAWLWIIGMNLKRSGQFPQGQKFVIVANHISYLDTLNIYAAIPEYFRPLGKKEAGKIPVFGIIYKQLVILVDRSSAESRAKSMRLMWRQLKRECCITVFPEGTFNETGETLKNFYDGAFRLAINTQTPILPLLFPDTEQRWHYSAWWKMWPGKNRAVFLKPISVEGLTMDDISYLREHVKALMAKKMVELNEERSR